MINAISDSEDNCTLMRPCVGDRQGDGGAPRRYILAADPRLDRWSATTTDETDHRHLCMRDPWDERWKTVAHIQYADDCARVGASEDPEQLANKVNRWRQSLEQWMEPLRISQNEGNMEILVRLHKNGYGEHRRLQVALREMNMLQNVTNQADHLGSLHEARCSGQAELRRNLAQAKSSWCAWHGIWRAKRVPLSWKLCIFKATIQSAALK